MDEIIRILDKYNNNGKMADKAFVDQMCITLADLYDVHRYLADVKVNYSRKKKLGSNYNSINHVLTMNLEQDYSTIMAARYDDLYYYWYNAEVTLSILHEFEHIIQEKTRIEKPFTFESKIINLCDIRSDKLSDSFKLYRTFRKYARYHDMVPTERMANVRSGKAFKDVLDNISDNEIISSFRAHFNDMNAKQISAGYVLKGDITNSPSLDYLSIIKHDDIEAPKDLSFEKRLYLGLPLKKCEYNLISK